MPEEASGGWGQSLPGTRPHWQLPPRVGWNCVALSKLGVTQALVSQGLDDSKSCCKCGKRVNTRRSKDSISGPAVEHLGCGNPETVIHGCSATPLRPGWKSFSSDLRNVSFKAQRQTDKVFQKKIRYEFQRINLKSFGARKIEESAGHLNLDPNILWDIERLPPHNSSGMV